jgi:hypothetical protein
MSRLWSVLAFSPFADDRVKLRAKPVVVDNKKFIVRLRTTEILPPAKQAGCNSQSFYTLTRVALRFRPQTDLRHFNLDNQIIYPVIRRQII